MMHNEYNTESTSQNHTKSLEFAMTVIIRIIQLKLIIGIDPLNNWEYFRYMAEEWIYIKVGNLSTKNSKDIQALQMQYFHFEWCMFPKRLILFLYRMQWRSK